MYRRRRILDGKPVIERYGEWMISVTSDKSRIPNSGGKLIITASAVRYVYWSNDETTEEFGDVTLSNPSIGSLSGSTLTIPANHDISEKSIRITGSIEDKSFRISCTGK